MQCVHLIGIGGTGLSAIARVLLESGHTVSGSDLYMSPLADALVDSGVRVDLGHQAENVRGADIVVRSSAIPDSNPEVQAALSAGIPVLKRADFLGRLMADRQGIAVAGAHGKTTTTAMLAWILMVLEQDPTFIVGGVVTNLGTNARAGAGPFFLIEADEYDRMFLGLSPKIAVVTNVEHDHPDIYATPETFRQVFRDFVALLPEDGVLLACGNDPGAADLLPEVASKGIRSLSYGQPDLHAPIPNPDYQARNLTLGSHGGFAFDVFRNSHHLVAVELRVPGEHNVQNALAALAVIDVLGLSTPDAARALASFCGSGRRFEVLGEVGDVIVVDDYAHHPTEIQATLLAARARYPDRPIWAVWQPHTYSRTKTLFDKFAGAFNGAEHVVVTEVYRSREPLDPDFSAAQVVKAMHHQDAHFLASLVDATVFLLARLRPGDVLIVLSAGDANQICTRVLAGLYPCEA